MNRAWLPLASSIATAGTLIAGAATGNRGWLCTAAVLFLVTVLLAGLSNSPRPPR